VPIAAPAAGVELVSAEREVIAAASFDFGAPRIENTTASGSWQRSVSSGGSSPTPFQYQWSAVASQDSNVVEAGITAAGESWSNGIAFTACGFCVPGGAASDLDVVFDVTTPTPWELLGSIETEATDLVGGTVFNGHVRVRVRLLPAAGGTPIASFELSPTSATPRITTLPVAASGTLPAGSYRFVIESGATYPLRPVSAGLTRATYDVVLDLAGEAPPQVPVVPVAWLALLAAALLAGGILTVAPRARAR
jgi:hypothetical protein